VPGARHPHQQRPHTGDDVSLGAASAGVGPLGTPFIVPHSQVAIPRLDRHPASDALPTLPGGLGEIAPDLLPTLCRAGWPLLRPRC